MPSAKTITSKHNAGSEPIRQGRQDGWSIAITNGVSGGWSRWRGAGRGGAVGEDLVTLDLRSWLVSGTNFDGSDWSVSAVAICANAAD